MKTIIIDHPSEWKYKELYENYSTSLDCKCSQLTVPFDDSIRITPIMHEICSSQFVSSEWYRHFLSVNVTPHEIPEHFSYTGASYFQLLASFCSLAQYSIDDSLRLFAARLYLNDKVLPEWQFQQQMQAFIDTFTNTTRNEFIRIFSLVRNATTGNQFVTGPSLNGRIEIKSNQTILRRSRTWYELDINNPGQGVAVCICTRGGPRCGFFIRHPASSHESLTSLDGQYIGCLIMDGLLISSLECWYNQSCVDRLSRWVVEEGAPDHFDIKALNASSPSRFTKKSSMSRLIDELLLERWIINISYTKFYHQCAPKSCTYNLRGRYDLVYAVLLIIAIYGGLSTVLEIVVPYFMHSTSFLGFHWKQQRLSK